MAVEGRDVNLTQLQVELLNSEGIYVNEKAPEKIGKELSKYNDWKSKILNRVIKASIRSSIIGGSVTLGFLGFVAVAGAVPMILPVGLAPFISGAVGAAATVSSSVVAWKLTSFLEKSNAQRVNSSIRKHNRKFDEKIAIKFDQEELTPKQQKKYAKLLQKEQKYLGRQYYEGIRSWEKLLRKGDVAEFIQSPKSAGLPSNDFEDFCQWQSEISAIANRYNEITKKAQKFGFDKNNKFSPLITISEKRLNNYDAQKSLDVFISEKTLKSATENSTRLEAFEGKVEKIENQKPRVSKVSQIKAIVSKKVKKNKALESDSADFQAYDLSNNANNAKNAEQIIPEEVKKRDVRRQAPSRSNRNGNAMRF